MSANMHTPAELLPAYIEKLLTQNARKVETRVLLEGALGIVDEARGHLGAALVQSLPSDDQIILDHVRAAENHLDTLPGRLQVVLAQEKGGAV